MTAPKKAPWARRATIIDVAQEAGVSMKSVSRVINQEANVSPALRERVLQATQILNYIPNVAARGLAGGRTFLLGLAFGNVSPHYAAGLQAAVSERLAKGPYRLVLLPMNDVANAAQDIRLVTRASGLEGLLLVPPISDDPAVRRALEDLAVPYACVTPDSLGPCVDDANGEDVRATREFIGYLAGLGHRDIAIIRGDPSHTSSVARFEGFLLGLREQGIPYREDLDEPGRYTAESGYHATSILLERPHPPTAIFACNDDMAAGALLAARDLRIDVPTQLSIAGFDDSDLASMVFPRLTTVHQPFLDMASRAAERLFHLMQDSPLPEWDPIRFRVVHRESCGPARATKRIPRRQ